MQIEGELLKLISDRFSKAFDRILLAINQLNDDQIWYRPSEHSNSIGILIQHLTGNLNQWVISAIGGAHYQRNRPQEFVESVHISKEDILTKVVDLQNNIEEIISKVSPESLLSPRKIQGFDETVMSALISSETHLELHSGQIIFISKLILGDKYNLSWKPKNKEQGA